MESIRAVSDPRAGSADVDFVRDGLSLFYVAATGDSYFSPLGIFLRDERDAILVDACGHVWGGWLDLSLLWVAEPLRGRGYGRKLLEAAEDEARSQGCRGVFLSNFNFQSRPFYERFGYEVVADLPDYPAGHTHHVLKKSLQGA